MRESADPVALYRDSDLFRALRRPDLLTGRCGRCEYAESCGGSRARAFAATGDAYGGGSPLLLRAGRLKQMPQWGFRAPPSPAGGITARASLLALLPSNHPTLLRDSAGPQRLGPRRTAGIPLALLSANRFTYTVRKGAAPQRRADGWDHGD